MTPPKPSRRRLTQAEWEAELARAKGVQAADVERHVERPKSYGCFRCDQKTTTEAAMVEHHRTVHGTTIRTGRRRSWWQRGWKR